MPLLYFEADIAQGVLVAPWVPERHITKLDADSVLESLGVFRERDGVLVLLDAVGDIGDLVELDELCHDVGYAL